MKSGKHNFDFINFKSNGTNEGVSSENIEKDIKPCENKRVRFSVKPSNVAKDSNYNEATDFEIKHKVSICLEFNNRKLPINLKYI